MYNIVSVDDLATKVARASAVMILILKDPNNQLRKIPTMTATDSQEFLHLLTNIHTYFQHSGTEMVNSS